MPIDKELHSDDVINFMNVSESKCILGDNKNLKKINIMLLLLLKHLVWGLIYLMLDVQFITILVHL